MKQRFSFIKRKPRQETTDAATVDSFLQTNTGAAQYMNRQAPYSNNVVPYDNSQQRPELASSHPPYRAVPPTAPLNQQQPRTTNTTGLPYPSTPRPFQPTPNIGLDTNIGYGRDRTPSNPSLAPSHGSNGSQSNFSLISTPQNSSPRQPSASPASSYVISPGTAPVPHPGRSNELPVPGAMPYMPHSTQNAYQETRQHHSRGSSQNGYSQYPPRAAPGVPPQPTPPVQAYAPAAAPSSRRNGPQYLSEDIPSHRVDNNGVNQDKLRLQRKHNTSKTYIRQLRVLIREKYRLDVWIWDHREVLKADRPLVKAECAKSDAVMQEIYHIINHWEEDLFEPEEWRVAKKIKENINKHPEQHTQWNELLPWDRPVEAEVSEDLGAKMSDLSL